MRRVTSTLFLLLFVIALLASAPLTRVNARPLLVETNPGTTSLSAWWSLNETSGSRSDSHGSNTLTDNNTVTYNPGKQSNAAQFTSANSEYLSIADNAALSQSATSSFTFVGWVYLDDISASKIIAIKGPDSTGSSLDREFNLSYNVGTPSRFAFRVSNVTTSAIVNADNLGTPAASTWYFIVAWYDSSTTSIYIQVNNGTANSASSNGSYNSTYPFVLGSFSNASNFMNGRMDEVALYKRALTADERSYLYNSGNGRAYCEVANNCPTPTPSITNTPTNTATYTATATNTATATITNTPTNTATYTATHTATATNTGTATHTATVTNTANVTITLTPSDTPTYTPTATDTATATSTPTDTATPTATATATATRGTPVMPTWYIEPQITYGEYMLNISLLGLCGVVILAFFTIFIITIVRRKK